MKKLIAGTGVATLIVAGAGVAAAQTNEAPTTEAPAAQTDETPTTETPTTQTPTTESPTREPSDSGCAGMGERRGVAPDERPARFGLRAALIEAVGITPDELRAELEAGSTLAEVAEERGSDISEVIAEVVDEAEAWVAANPDSRLAQRFDAQEMTERLTEMANRQLDMEGRDAPGLGPERRRAAPPTGFEPVLPA